MRIGSDMVTESIAVVDLDHLMSLTATISVPHR